MQVWAVVCGGVRMHGWKCLLNTIFKKLDFVLADIPRVYLVQYFSPVAGSICSHPQIQVLTKRKWQIRDILPYQHQCFWSWFDFGDPIFAQWQQLGQMQNLALGFENIHGNKEITFSAAWGSISSSHLLQFTKMNWMHEHHESFKKML